ncbi:hypothetical protein A994_05341 [Methanobacterium formicicum DSM 3637]|uniref:Phosphoribosyltransferase n=2 Tax=Methanobacterium formicicum TaxID=2162 RepID=K2RC82_METFP|nr:hypothetical protein A994_05341 [Methanobacterium formicicum DSM 3637]
MIKSYVLILFDIISNRKNYNINSEEFYIFKKDYKIPPEDTERLKNLSRSLESYRGNLKFVDYKNAEEACEKLASKILAVYSPKELESFYFMAIPRGGLIVLGMLSYLLNLKQSQFETSDQPDQPVMIVDDIALTGKRISKILSNTQSSHVVIANLYSHPDLRKSILEKEPRVKYCFSAHDLKDQARGNYPDTNDYYSWRKKMNKRMGGRYWIGQVDLVGFAWSEPDYPFWNPVTDKLEDGWRSLPPHKCLKNRSIFGILPDESATKDLQLSSAVIMGCFHDEIWLFQKDTQQIYSLTGVAAEIWRVLVSYGNIESSIPYLMDKYDVEESILRLDLESYVDDLLEIKIFKKRDS